MRGHIDKTMAIAAIHPELRDVQIMREGHGLDRLITDARIFRGDVMRGPGRQTANDDHAADRDFERQPICPAWKKFAIALSELCFREGPAAKIKTAQSCC